MRTPVKIVRLIAAIAFAAMLTPVGAAEAAPGPSGSTSAVLAAINAERANAGLPSIALDGGDTAQGAADNYMATGVAHSSSYSWTIGGGWRSREIAASVSGTTGEAISLWMGSAGHRRAVLDDSAEAVRIGVTCRDTDGRMFVVAQIKVRSGSAEGLSPGAVTSSSSGPRCPAPPPPTTTTPPTTLPPPTVPPVVPPPTNPPSTTPSRPGPTTPNRPGTTTPATTTTVALTTSSTSTSTTVASATTTPEALPPVEGPDGGAPPPSETETSAPRANSDITINEGGPSSGGNKTWLLIVAVVALLGAVTGVVALVRFGGTRPGHSDGLESYGPDDGYEHYDGPSDGFEPEAPYDPESPWDPSYE